MLDVRAADERDSAWENSDPRFRVYFFEPAGDSFSSQVHDLGGCDVLQAVEWARAHANGRLFSVALVDDPAHPHEAARGLRWILGNDANDSATTAWSAEARRRMMDGYPDATPPR